MKHFHSGNIFRLMSKRSEIRNSIKGIYKDMKLRLQEETPVVEEPVEEVAEETEEVAA